MRLCGTACIPTASCCVASDCTGACRTCSAPGGTCVPVRNQDDPDSCAGTCDAGGTCKKRHGDACTPGEAASCLSGFCVDGRCCTRDACSTCESCTGAGGICSQVVRAEDPGTCAGLQKCDAAGRCADRFTEFPIEGTPFPLGIAQGPDGNMWFADKDNMAIGRSTISGSIVMYPVSGEPNSITAGPDGNLWFTMSGTSERIARMTPAGVVTGEFPVTGGLGGGDIRVGPDQRIWFAEFVGNKIGRIDSNGNLMEYPLPTANSRPLGVCSGPDGNIWFTEGMGNKVGRMTTEGAGLVEFSVPTPGAAVSFITAGQDGNLWFTEFVANKIGRITVTGAITEFPLPNLSSGPELLVRGPDGQIWFTEYAGNRIGRIDAAGAIIEYTVPTSASSPFAIAVGPDMNLWFTEVDGGRIGMFTP